MFVEQTPVAQSKSTILCPLCGLKFIPEGSNICPACTLASIDNQPLLKAGQDQALCTYCNRYERPPWIHCDRQSPELLAALLKKVKGLGKSQIKNAKFIWTEPHSKRIRIKIEFVRSIDEHTKVQQTEVVTFIEKYSQCPDCKKNFTPHDWVSLVQIRQHAQHKRTLLALEQNLMRQKWMEKAMRVQSVEGGIDIFFKHEQDSVRCIGYIKKYVPVVEKTSRELISQDLKNNTSNTKITHALLIPKINKDDLLLMHPKFRKDLGNCCPLLLCLRVTSQLYFLDLTSNRKLVITPSQFASLQPYADIFNFQHYGRNFTVLDNEGIRNEESHNTVATYGLVVTPEDQMKELYVRSHLNCEIGSDYQGYSLEEWQYLKNLPSFILVKRIKTEEEKAKKQAYKDKKRKIRKEQRKKEREMLAKEAALLKQKQEDEHEDEKAEQQEEEGEAEWMDVDEEEDEDDS